MTESTQPSETRQTNTEPPKGEEGATLDEFRRLLEEDESPADDAGESQQHATSTEGESDGKPKGKPKALSDLAERLELKPEELYAIEIPLGGPDGKTLSLGKLKDAAAKQEDLTVRELKLEEAKAKQEAEWTRSQQELAELVGQLDPKALKPEVKQQVRDKIAAAHKRERELTLKAIPEWQDATVREAELAGMVEYLRDFGIHESYLTGMMNHKLFRLVRDGYLRKSRMEKALKAVEAVKKPSTTGKSGGGHGAAKRPAPPAKRRGTSDLRSRFESVLRQG